MSRNTERGILLLCCPLGQRELRPLSMAQFRDLSLRASAHGLGESDPMSCLRSRELQRLGYSAEQADRIEALLNREALLDRYLAEAEELGIRVLTRLSPDYPVQLWKQLGVFCPPALFYRGDPALLTRPCVSLVGSRKLARTGRAFSRRVGALAAQERLVLVSGGAAGADSEAQNACLAAGGQAAIFLADSLSERLGSTEPNLLLLSERSYDEPFSAARAASRNRLIHAMGRLTLAAQSAYGSGGTWTGCLENLKRGWSPVFVCDDGSLGAQGLIERGATAVSPEGPDCLSGLLPEDRQLSLF